jgi:hypothetical protein
MRVNCEDSAYGIAQRPRRAPLAWLQRKYAWKQYEEAAMRSSDAALNHIKNLNPGVLAVIDRCRADIKNGSMQKLWCML